MELFIPFVRNDGRGLRERRLKVSITADSSECIISEEVKIRNTWYDTKDDFDTINFPADKMLELAEALQRMNKLLVLK
jgi:hypothetical protein